MRTLMPWRRRGGILLEPLQREMEDLFQRFFEPLEENGQKALQIWAPRVDIEETDKEIVVKADLPGVDAKDVEVSLVEGALIVRGEKKAEKKEEKNYHRVERFEGQFYREIALPPGADPTKITATSAKGVVTIAIPKKAEVQPKKIAVTPKD